MTAIDLFSGLGGFTAGASAAGVQVVWAANHWPAAVEYHHANHPHARHSCQDLHQADWSAVPKHDVLLASPCCQGHTRARGKDRPHHDKQRSTAWAVVSCAEFHKPDHIVVENVPEFLKWALYPAWSIALQALGYSLSPHIVDAADFGVPQHRRRVFIIGTRSASPLQLKLPIRQHVGAENIVDFNSGRWSSVDKPGRSSATLARVEAGRATHGARFLTAYYGNERGGRSLQRPVGTITTRDRWSIVDGDRMRMFSIEECRKAMGFPANYKLPTRQKDAMMMLGNAVSPPVATDIITALRAAA
jgi:DNA (cytosine-5)-methyltransferase 1